MRSLVLLSVLLAGCSAFTEFKSCKNPLNIFRSGNERCFKTVLEEIKVDIASEKDSGTDDDVIIEVCSDYKVNDCCKTEVLKHRLKDDWSVGSTEFWHSSKFGACKDKEFLVKNALKVTVSKEKNRKNDKLLVKQMELTTKPKAKPKKGQQVEREVFRCGPFGLGSRKNPGNSKVLTCQPKAKFHAIHKASFAMGPGKDDGTDDRVFVKVCSDSNGQCCKKRLSGLLSDDWSKNSVETWDRGDFGNCSDVFYKIQNQPYISVSKTGKDNLAIANVTLEMDVRDAQWETKPKRLRLTCTDRNVVLDGTCKTDNLCSYTFQLCKKRLLDVDAKGRTVEPKAAGGVVTRSQTRTTKKPKTTTTTTAKPKKKGGLLGLLTGK